MQLRDGVLEFRNRVGEGNPWLYDDYDIVRWLNLSARNLVSKAQYLRDTYQGATIVGQQEYAMPLDLDQMIQGKILIGVLMPIQFGNQEDLQIGAYVSALPLAGYIRHGLVRTGVTSDGSEVIYGPPDTTGVPRWWVGFYPVPAAIYSFYIDYYRFHPNMENPLDYVILPDTADFMDAWVSYAVAKGMEKSGDMQSAQYYMAQHQAGIQMLKDYVCQANFQINPPQYGGSVGNPMFNRGPSVLILPTTTPTIGGA